MTENLSELVSLLDDESVTGTSPFLDFKSVKRKEEWLAVRVLLKQAAGVSLKIKYEQNGKPYLSPNIAHFSISHTKGIAGIALADSPVGIDLEQVGARAYSLQSYFLQPNEFDFSSVDDHDLFATYLWSAKESVYKLYGVDGLELKADIHLAPLNVNENYFELKAVVDGNDRQALVHGFLIENAVLTVAEYV